MNYSNIQQDGLSGVGLLNVNPDFVDSQSNNYNLNESSLCIDAGNPSSDYNDPDGTINDIGYSFYPNNNNSTDIIWSTETQLQIFC